MNWHVLKYIYVFIFLGAQFLIFHVELHYKIICFQVHIYVSKSVGFIGCAWVTLICLSGCP